MRPKGTPEELERRRRRAVALVEKGWSMRAVAEALGASPGSVSQWYAAYREGGDDALAAQPHPGRPSELTERQLKRLQKLLRQGPTRCGFSTELWTLKVHQTETVQRVLGRYQPRLHVHWLPVHASWLNQIEIFFSIIDRRVMRRGEFAETDELANKAIRFIDWYDEHQAKPFNWTYTGQPLAA